MRMSSFTEEQTIGFIKQAEAGLSIQDLCRKGGFSDATFYKWCAKSGGMVVPDAMWRWRAGMSARSWPSSMMRPLTRLQRAKKILVFASGALIIVKEISKLGSSVFELS